MPAPRGFTLIELLITISITAFLLATAAPLTLDWVYSAQTRDARGKLARAFSMTKSIALRNAGGAAAPSAASGLKILTDGTTNTVLACIGAAGSATCAVGGSSLKWSATYRAAISTTINGVALSAAAPLTIDLDNRGNALTGTAFTLSRGGSNNAETGTLY